MSAKYSLITIHEGSFTMPVSASYPVAQLALDIEELKSKSVPMEIKFGDFVVIQARFKDRQFKRNEKHAIQNKFNFQISYRNTSSKFFHLLLGFTNKSF